MQRWEYANITVGTIDLTEAAEQARAAGQPLVIERGGLIFSHQPPRTFPREEWGLTLRALGDDGWELVSVKEDQIASSFWFKRPQPDA
jgi:hypothetical protein